MGLFLIICVGVHIFLAVWLWYEIEDWVSLLTHTKSNLIWQADQWSWVVMDLSHSQLILIFLEQLVREKLIYHMNMYEPSCNNMFGGVFIYSLMPTRNLSFGTPPPCLCIFFEYSILSTFIEALGFGFVVNIDLLFEVCNMHIYGNSSSHFSPPLFFPDLLNSSWTLIVQVLNLLPLRKFLIDGCYCFVGIFRKMEEQKPKEQRPKASENKPIMTEWYLSCFKWVRMLDVLRAIIKVGDYLFKPMVMTLLLMVLTWIRMLFWVCNGHSFSLKTCFSLVYAWYMWVL